MNPNMPILHTYSKPSCKFFPEVAVLVDWANQNMKSKTWDNSKITAHHGIILTILSEKERNIYDLNVVTRNGWRDVYIEAEEEA